jgi:hypothetical protein
MSIFATPDFGASGVIACFILCVWGTVWLLVLIGILVARKWLRLGTVRARRWAVALLLLSASLPLCCCLGPDHLVRIVYGNYPLGRYPNGVIEKGMTPDEVLSKLGPPHSRNRNGDGESWYYMLDAYDMFYFGVIFGPDGRVTGTHGN